MQIAVAEITNGVGPDKLRNGYLFQARFFGTNRDDLQVESHCSLNTEYSRETNYYAVHRDNVDLVFEQLWCEANSKTADLTPSFVSANLRYLSLNTQKRWLSILGRPVIQDAVEKALDAKQYNLPHAVLALIRWCALLGISPGQSFLQRYFDNEVCHMLIKDFKEYTLDLIVPEKMELILLDREILDLLSPDQIAGSTLAKGKLAAWRSAELINSLHGCDCFELLLSRHKELFSEEILDMHLLPVFVSHYACEKEQKERALKIMTDRLHGGASRFTAYEHVTNEQIELLTGQPCYDFQGAKMLIEDGYDLNVLMRCGTQEEFCVAITGTAYPWELEILSETITAYFAPAIKTIKALFTSHSTGELDANSYQKYLQEIISRDQISGVMSAFSSLGAEELKAIIKLAGMEVATVLANSYDAHGTYSDMIKLLGDPESKVLMEEKLSQLDVKSPNFPEHWRQFLNEQNGSDDSHFRGEVWW